MSPYRSALGCQGFGLRHSLGKTKISNFDVRIIILTRQQQVLRLQIAMGDLFLVAVVDGGKKNLTSISSFFFVVVRFLYNSVKELPTHHLFCDHEIVLRFFKDIVEPDDVSVLHVLQDVDLVFQSDLIFLGELRFRDNLDSERISR